MLFNSFVFPVFLLAVWTLYICLKHRPQNVMLLVASYFFYGWWDWRFLGLLFFSTVSDYLIAMAMGNDPEKNPGRRKFLLILSMVFSLGILGFFKYFNFFADSVVNICSPLGFRPDFVTLNILLPVGISFYTFQTMAYTIDVYRGREKVCWNFIDFALYVSYFPQLVAGPIERSTNLIPQIAKPRTVDKAMIYSAAQLILVGYFKKVFIADGVAPIVNQCFNEPEYFGGISLLFGIYLFAFQIYGDFSGYTDIARGVSRLFGIELMLNFRQPYLSTNITEFWRRWHISLSLWLRDYLYIPLGGNRGGETRTGVNNMLTMLLGGLWHGAGLQFIVWGALHGTYLAVHKRMLGGKKPEEWNPWTCQTTKSRWWIWICWIAQTFFTFNLVSFAWIFFRADSCAQAFQYIGRIAQGGFFHIETPILYYVVNLSLILCIDLSCAIQNSEVPFTEKWGVFGRGLAYGCILSLLFFVGENGSQPFIYFQF